MAAMGRVSPASRKTWVFFLWLEVVLVTVGVGDHTRNTDGFISIDCGIADGHSYTDDKTTIPYNSDTNYVATGVNRNISTRFDSDTRIATQDRTLRSFPQDKRSCYTLPAEEGQKYLVRATFLHGNYDGRKVSSVDPILFDLHLGVNLWESVNISDVTRTHETEVITVALAGGYISVCLVNKDKGTPFISSLELRPLRKETLYPVATASVALVKYSRVDFGGSIELRFPDDPYDRIWTPFNDDNKWTRIRTTSLVQRRVDDMFEVPSAVLQTAVVPSNSTEAELFFWWGLPNNEDVRPQFHIFMYFAELQPLALGQSRNFIVYFNGNPWWGPFSPPYLFSTYVYTTSPCEMYQYNFSIKETATSTLPPIINALETYIVMQLTEKATDSSDVEAIGAIKKRYKVKRNWMGDPCAPEVYKWDGLDCSYSVSDSPRITTVNLSSGGLMGTIDSSFAELKAIKYLDLSYNNLTGQIPETLVELPILEVLNLSNNQLTGSVPSALLLKTQNGSLTLRIEGNPNLCANEDSCMVTPTSTNKKISTPLIVILCIVAVVLLVVIAIFWRLRKRQGLKDHGGTMQATDNHDRSLQLENRQFTYTELKSITNNFEKVLGKGGFGTVYHGYLEDCTEVAVKMRSESSSQETKEFFAEAQSLTRVHHRNLVSLIGYCKDRDYLALVYEYMSQGTLRDHLQGRTHTAAIALSWGQRLQIAVDAAQGLEYLHKGCRPPLIHRDVKSANILLSERLEAKIADFGLSKTFQSEVNTHVSTAVVGTPGYLDPEYYNNYQLSEKTDVYSFGVVLLELITGQPPVLQVPGDSHIIQRVNRGLAAGNVQDIVDPRLRGEYDVNSVWKCVEVALKCTSQRSQQRPAMADVVLQLKESLELQTHRDRNENPITSNGERYMEGGVSIGSNPYVVEMTVVSGGPSAR